jgi:predicted ArsR family transcriptional regulator
MQSEHARIRDLCRHPTAVVEIAAELSLPVTVVRILLDDLRAMGRITARHPRTAASHAALPDSELLKEVLHGLRKL